MKKFTRRVEDFDCAHCGTHVSGNGYTNHCPNCLWSRHVDTTPGDRASTCAGMMRPMAAAPDGDRFIITHTCEKCGKTIRQHTAPNDNTDVIIALMQNPEFIYGK